MLIYETMAGRSASEKKKPIKILLVGEPETGKSSLCSVKPFSEAYKPTVGIGFECKQIWVEKLPAVVQLWDISAQDDKVAALYYRDADGVFIVFDMSKEGSLQNTLNWRKKLQSDLQIPFYLIGNKLDLLSEDNVHDCRTEAEIFCAEHNFQGVFFTSAKTGAGFDEAVTLACEEISHVSKIRNLTKSALECESAEEGGGIKEESSTSELLLAAAEKKTEFCFCQ